MKIGENSFRDVDVRRALKNIDPENRVAVAERLAWLVGRRWARHMYGNTNPNLNPVARLASWNFGFIHEHVPGVAHIFPPDGAKMWRFSVSAYTIETAGWVACRGVVEIPIDAKDVDAAVML